MGERIEQHRTRSRSRPPHLRGVYLAFVALGGAVGAAGREGLSLLLPPLGQVPVAIALINVLGAFLLGYLFEALTHLDPDHPTGHKIKLLLGTGFCGGFTTYSALATGTAFLMLDGLPWLAAGYAFGTVIIGAVATWAGIVLAARLHPSAVLPTAPLGVSE